MIQAKDDAGCAVVRSEEILEVFGSRAGRKC